MSEPRSSLKRPRPSYGDSPSEVECDWEMTKLPFREFRLPLLSPLDIASTQQIRQQLQDLRREQIAAPLLRIVTKLMLHRINQSMFNTPVDPVRLACPTYYDVISNPMDLGTIKQNLIALSYACSDEVIRDIKLVFENAMKFNPPGHFVHEAAMLLQKEFEREYNSYLRKQRDRAIKRKEHWCHQCQGHVCRLCEEKCINFEPPLVMCVGKCGQRLRRHSQYFTTTDHELSWCAKCVPKKNEVVGGRMVHKSELVKAKFQDELTEPWVHCDTCMGWVHQICGLFNADVVVDDDVPYTCPLCRLREDEYSIDDVPKAPLDSEHLTVDLSLATTSKRKYEDMSTHSPIVKKSITIKSSVVFKDPVDTPTYLGSFMQKWIREHLVTLGEPEAAQTILVKLASSVKVTCPVTANVRNHFRLNGHEYPEHVTYTSKAILVFQQIDGVEVCLFSMYVQEYNHDCGLSSNVNRTYIAYLDSLGYFRPRHARTSVYQQLVIAYLAFAKIRGFTHAHIWACPTTRGGDFIYWCHPVYQRNPSKDRLLSWYRSVIDAAREKHVAFGQDTFWSTHFEPLQLGLSSAQLPPFFSGDYWPAELDRVVAMPQRRAKKKTTETIVDTDVKSRDAIKTNIYHSVFSSRDSLFVIPLQPTCHSCSAVLVNVAYWEKANQVCCDACLPVGAADCFKRQDLPLFVTAQAADDDPEVTCPFLDKRTEMLKNCEINHYQFDTFRRAKYSTMMLLHHIKASSKILNSQSK
jgi:E1A/CREB-binding protein